MRLVEVPPLGEGHSTPPGSRERRDGTREKLRDRRESSSDQTNICNCSPRENTRAVRTLHVASPPPARGRVSRTLSLAAFYRMRVNHVTPRMCTVPGRRVCATPNTRNHSGQSVSGCVCRDDPLVSPFLSPSPLLPPFLPVLRMCSDSRVRRDGGGLK